MTLADGAVLQDSRVICEYLDALDGAPVLFPAGPARWSALRRQALADGLLDLAVAWRGERNRDAGRQSRAHLDAYRAKACATLDRLDGEAPRGDVPIDIGWITIGCALGYLDFRFADLYWRAGRPSLAGWFSGFARRSSMRATDIVDDSGKPA
jgi:glutathione S-transferase